MPVPAGAMATMVVPEATFTVKDETVPKETAAPFKKLAPKRVTGYPPSSDAWEGLIPLKVGGTSVPVGVFTGVLVGVGVAVVVGE